MISDGANYFQNIRRHFSECQVDISRFCGQYLENCRGISGIPPADLKLIFVLPETRNEENQTMGILDISV